MDTTGLKLHDVVGSSDGDAAGNVDAAEVREETCVYIMSSSSGIACMRQFPSLKRTKTRK